MVAVSALLEGPCLTLKSQVQLREGVTQNAGQVLWSPGSLSPREGGGGVVDDNLARSSTAAAGDPCPFNQVTQAHLPRPALEAGRGCERHLRTFGSGKVHLPSPQVKR